MEAGPWAAPLRKGTWFLTGSTEPCGSAHDASPAPPRLSGRNGRTWPTGLSCRAGCSDAGDVGGEEVDAMAVEVAAATVVVLGGAGVSVPGQDLGVAERHAGVQGIGDCGVAQRVRADVSGDARRPSRSAAPSGRRRAGRSGCPTSVGGSAALRRVGRGRLRASGALGR